MKGGAREQLIDIVKKYAQPLNVYVGIVLVLAITYIGQIPKSVSFRANTTLGRLVLFALTIVIADTYSWIYALLMALFTVLIIAVAPRTLKENFQDVNGDVDVKLVSQKKRWWAEEVLKENPLGIEEDNVKTRAIQDNSNASNSTTSSR
jgi:c-di-AMP phosphodiesterase-like protein